MAMLQLLVEHENFTSDSLFFFPGVKDGGQEKGKGEEGEQIPWPLGPLTD